MLVAVSTALFHSRCWLNSTGKYAPLVLVLLTRAEQTERLGGTFGYLRVVVAFKKAMAISTVRFVVFVRGSVLALHYSTV